MCEGDNSFSKPYQEFGKMSNRPLHLLPSQAHIPYSTLNKYGCKWSLAPPLFLQHTFLIQFSINIAVNPLLRLRPPPAHIPLSFPSSSGYNSILVKYWCKPKSCITKPIIPKDIQAFASHNQLLLRRYQILHHRTNYLKEIQFFAPQNQLSLSKYKVLLPKTNYFISKTKINPNETKKT